MTGMTVQARYAGALMNTFGPPRLTLVRGEGPRVWDDAGREYLDLFGGIAVNALGHGHPALVDAVTTQLRTLGHVSNFFATEPQVTLAERLLALLGAAGTAGRVFFANSGAEANEAGLKLTRRTGRTHLVAAEGCFHGRTMGSLALTHKPAFREPFEPLPGHVTWVPYGDADALAAAVSDETAAVVLEPIQGEAGVVVPPDGYLAAARRLASEHGALLWLDEVQTGVGRTGEWFAHDAAVRPDVVTLAKGLGGGIPIGACVGLGDAGALLGPGHHGSTFGGNPVASAAALAVLDTIEKEGLLEAARERGHQLSTALVSEQQVTDVSGRGLLLAAHLADETAPQVVARAQERGFLLNNTGPDRLRFAPPLTVTERDLARFADAWRDLVTDPDREEQP
jgi:acetylornithine/N-succinyldiaminopimelate aminotransferase